MKDLEIRNNDGREWLDITPGPNGINISVMDGQAYAFTLISRNDLAKIVQWAIDEGIVTVTPTTKMVAWAE